MKGSSMKLPEVMGTVIAGASMPMGRAGWNKVVELLGN
jgi:hypothetical protein